MIQSQPQEAWLAGTPPTTAASIKVTKGTAVQNYNTQTGSYEPSRSVMPLCLYPGISVFDNETNKLTDIHPDPATIRWYRGAPKPGDANIIVSGTYLGYKVGASKTLEISVNTPYDKPEEIYCVFGFEYDGSIRTVEASITLRTTRYTADGQLRFKPRGPLNPVVALKSKQDLDNRNVELIMDVWRGEKRISWKLEGDDCTYWGNNGYDFAFDTFSISIPARHVNGPDYRNSGFSFQYSLTDPVSKWNYGGKIHFSPTAEVPSTLRIEVIQDSYFRLTRNVRMHYHLRAWFPGEGDLPKEDVEALLQVEWYVKSGKPGSSEIKVGDGYACNFVPYGSASGQLGLPEGYPFEVYAKAKIFKYSYMGGSGKETYVYE